MSIWCSEGNTKIFYKSALSNEPEPIINNALEQNELDEIYNFINGSGYEYVSVNKKIVEFGESTGSITMYYCLTDEKPEKLSNNHRLYNFGDGWYFCKSIAR